MAKRVSKQKQAELAAKQRLQELCPPGTTIWTRNVRVARSGMSAVIGVYIMQDNVPLDITSEVSDALGWAYVSDGGGVRVHGCGLDRGFHVVHTLSYAIHGATSKGKGIEAANRGVPFEPNPENYRAGYSLNHRWL